MKALLVLWFNVQLARSARFNVHFGRLGGISVGGIRLGARCCTKAFTLVLKVTSSHGGKKRRRRRGGGGYVESKSMCVKITYHAKNFVLHCGRHEREEVIFKKKSKKI